MLHLIKCFCPKHLIKNSLQFEWIAVFFFLMLLQYEVLVVLSFLTSTFMQYLQFSRKYVATNFLLNLSFTAFLCTVYINFLIIIYMLNMLIHIHYMTHQVCHYRVYCVPVRTIHIFSICFWCIVHQFYIHVLLVVNKFNLLWKKKFLFLCISKVTEQIYCLSHITMSYNADAQL